MLLTLPIVGACEEGSSVTGATTVVAVGDSETGATVVGSAVCGADVIGRSVSIAARTGTSKKTAETGPA